MDKNEQFAGFGRAVIQRMLAQRRGEYIDFNSDDTEAIEEYSTIVAQAASALVSHAFTHFWSGADAEVGFYPDKEMIPDLDELPKAEQMKKRYKPVLNIDITDPEKAYPAGGSYTSTSTI